MHEDMCETGSQIPRALCKGLRPVLEGFCPNARRHVRNRKSNPEGVSPRDLTYCSRKPECIGTTNPDRLVLITIITWHFQFHPVTWCPLTTGIVASQYPSSRDTAREALPQAFNIGVFEYGKSNPTTIKHIYLNESCDVAFDSNDWWNLP